MKKYCLLLLLLLSFLIGIFHHEIIYSFHHVEHHENSINSTELNNSHSHHNHHEDVNHEENPSDDNVLSRWSNKVKGKILKDFLQIWKIDFIHSNIVYFDEKNLFKKEFPPYYFRNIKNYSYSTLIKIIKSNT